LRNNIENNSVDGIVYPSIQHREKSNLALFPKVIDEGRMIFQYPVDAIFQKSLEVDTKGLPSYVGPFESSRGIHELSTNKIVWVWMVFADWKMENQEIELKVNWKKNISAVFFIQKGGFLYENQIFEAGEFSWYLTSYKIAR